MHAPLNRDDGGLLPDSSLHPINKTKVEKSKVGHPLRYKDTIIRDIVKREVYVESDRGRPAGLAGIYN